MHLVLFFSDIVIICVLTSVCMCGSSPSRWNFAMGPKSFSRVSKSVYGHCKSPTCTIFFCNILILMCFNILDVKAESCSDN